MANFRGRCSGRFNYEKGPGVSFEGCKVRTQQHFKDECDINRIVKKAMKSGVLPSGSRAPMFGDFSDVSFQSMQDCILVAKSAFDRLSSSVRLRFNNNPDELLSFISDPANQDEAIKLGLIDAPAPVVPEPIVPEPVVPEPPVV